MPGSALLSDILGYTSITCWLGAQFPQVLENLRRQSCEGLALPFLANWFLGDFSNLIGCILTRQLPFQAYLATYFCLIDLVLLAQYLYYGGSPKAPALRPPPPSYSQRAASVIPTSRRLSLDRSTTRYRTLSAVAANVAAAAALAAQQEDSTHHTTRHNNSDPLLRADGLQSFTSNIPLGREGHGTIDADLDDGDPTGLVDSFYSEGGRDIGRKRVSWSIERHRTRAGSFSRVSAIQPPLVSPVALDMSNVRRGRSLGRSTEGLLEGSEDALASEPMSPPSTATNRRGSRARKKSATMVFLGAWALFGVGAFVGTKRGMPNKSALRTGRVLSSMDVRGSMGTDVPIALTTPLPNAEHSIIPDVPQAIPLTFEDQDPLPTAPTPPPPDAHASAERILGRIFAWLCTTLYLTSRLPQIWKNLSGRLKFVRKSLEGLSMYLFVFAFLGNVFYVASILFSPNVYLPPPESTDFIKESIPYLLGSGGTLIFDVIIVTQSFIYKPKHKRRHARSGESTAANLEGGVDVTESERTGLLAGDALAKHHHHTYSHPNPHQHSQQQQQQHASRSTTIPIDESSDDVTRGRTTHVARSLSD
ncbi:putative vacuolar amino acid transporter YPQ3 [Leucoagaricus sp. SymC.cos]|nr:putative vacuolar amino acid transporter YPQ3 [Leucoagaricus sp. SymC.cos]